MLKSCYSLKRFKSTHQWIFSRIAQNRSSDVGRFPNHDVCTNVWCKQNCLSNVDSEYARFHPVIDTSDTVDSDASDVDEVVVPGVIDKNCRDYLGWRCSYRLSEPEVAIMTKKTLHQRLLNSKRVDFAQSMTRIPEARRHRPLSERMQRAESRQDRKVSKHRKIIEFFKVARQ